MKLFVLLVGLVVLPGIVQADNAWSRIILPGGTYTMMGFAPPELKAADTLNIFIEGDGRPGVALELAKSIGGNSVYLARPCQFMVGSWTSSCNKALWTSNRYSSQVVRSMNRAITALKLRYRAKQVRLIGFSGGGTIASIIAAHRKDMALLVTVAGNLDHRRWTEYNQIKPLSGSLNPVDYSEALEQVPQIHLIGDRDNVVPGSVLASYLAKLNDLDRVQSYIVTGADHTCCWDVALASALQ